MSLVMKKRGLSLRYKILIALTALPLVGMSLFLSLAVNVFKKDKVAYVFDTSLSESKTKAARVRSELNSLISVTQSVVLSYNASTKSLAESGQYFFDRDGKYQAFELYAFNAETKAYEKNVNLEKEDAKAAVKDDAEALNAVFEKAKGQSVVVARPVSAPTSVLLGLRFGDVSDPRHVIAVSMFKAADLVETFKESAAGYSFLFLQGGEALFAPSTWNGRGSKWTPTQIWAQLGVKQDRERSAEILSPKQDPYLASFVAVELGDLYVVSLVDKDKALMAVQDLLRKSLIFFIGLISFMTIISVIASRGLTGALRHLFDATRRVSEGNFDVRVDVKSSDEIGSLATSFNSMAEEVSRLMAETAEKARMESELATAKTVQETLFPETIAALGPVEIAGHYQPASECGGDWWYYYDSDDKVFLWIGDATGHGAPAALITSAARAVASVIQSGPPLSPAQSLSLLNKAICETSKGRMMMTFFLGCIDKKTGVLTYANASHEAPYLLKKTDEPPKRSDYTPLNEVNNPRLGEKPGLMFKEAKIQLDPGDRIILYTDGVTDLKNDEAKPWGERRFLKTLSSSLHETTAPGEALQKVVADLQEFRQSHPLDDDVTLVVCHYRGAA